MASLLGVSSAFADSVRSQEVNIGMLFRDLAVFGNLLKLCDDAETLHSVRKGEKNLELKGKFVHSVISCTVTMGLQTVLESEVCLSGDISKVLFEAVSIDFIITELEAVVKDEVDTDIRGNHGVGKD